MLIFGKYYEFYILNFLKVSGVDSILKYKRVFICQLSLLKGKRNFLPLLGGKINMKCIKMQLKLNQFCRVKALA